MKKFLIGYMMLFIFVTIGGFISSFVVIASDIEGAFEIIPEGDPNEYREKVIELGNAESSSGPDKFWNRYNDSAKTLGEGKKGLGNQLGGGLVNRDTILRLLSQVVKFLSNMALVVGAGMIIYAGYLYASHVFSGADASAANNAIKYAVMGIIVVIFSYTILRIVIHMFH